MLSVRRELWVVVGFQPATGHPRNRAPTESKFREMVKRVPWVIVRFGRPSTTHATEPSHRRLKTLKCVCKVLIEVLPNMGAP